MASLKVLPERRDKLNKFRKLLGEKAYVEFLDNVKDIGNEDLDRLLNRHTPSSILYGAFIWVESPEGHDYWERVAERIHGITFDSEPITTNSTGITTEPTPQRTKSVLELAYEDTERRRQEILNRLRGISS